MFKDVITKHKKSKKLEANFQVTSNKKLVSKINMSRMIIYKGRVL